MNMMLQESFLRPFLGQHFSWLYASSGWWLLVGFSANILFGSRFIFQWLETEKRGRVVVPTYFWYLSFWGSVLNVLYALHLDNLPILLGVIALPFIYGRNIFFLKKGAARKGANPAPLLPQRKLC